MLVSPDSCKLRRRAVPQCAMRSSLVVIHPPGRNDCARFSQRPEPVLVQALVPELAVEALDIRVLRRFTSLDEPQLDASLIRPLVQCPAGKLRSLVGPDDFRQGPKLRRLIEHPRDVLAGDPVI